MTSSKDPKSLALGSLLREYREWAGYSRDAVAERVGISANQLERWEIVGVPLPLSKRLLAVAEFLEIDESTVEAALAGPPRYLPHDPIEVYEAAPELEEAIAVHGWTAEEVAEALATSPTKVQAWRLGAIKMTEAERLTLCNLRHLRNEPTSE